jgi:glycosyltransferase involved in cell wall biosynthesis
MSRKVNVLFLAYDGMTDPLGQSQVLSYLRLLSLQGFSFDIISFEKPGVYAAKKSLLEESIKGYDIRWHPLPYTKSPPVLSTLKDLWMGWKKVKQLAQDRQIDIVHSRGYIIGNIARATKRVYGAKLIFDMRGWWADEKLESGLWASPLYRPVYKYFKKLEKQLFEESDYSISLTHVGSDEIERLALKQKHQVGIIPTCVDFEIFRPFDAGIRSEVRRELNIPESSKVLLYSGSLGGNYGTDMLLDLFKAFKAAYPDFYLLVLSKTDKGYIDNEVRKHKVDAASVRIVDADFKHVHRYLMAGDYGVVNYNRTYSTIGRSPTKLGEYWACGLPVIAQSNVGDMDYLLQRYPEGGLLLNELKEAEYTALVHTALNLTLDRDKLREYSLDYYDLNKGADTYAKIYNAVLKN